MAEEPMAKPLWRFADSPFTWGGIGVVIGSAVVTPVWFRYAFVGGGISIGIGFLRAGIFTGRHIVYRAITQVVLLLGLATCWWLLWKVIPKPEEPLTRKGAQEILRQFQSFNRPSPVIETSEKPLTKTDLEKIFQQQVKIKTPQTGEPQVSVSGWVFRKWRL
jgi:hypothetical protein